MRIISGTHKGRRIHPDKSFKARPTTDFAKETLFNVLNNQIDFDRLEVLDLFSGTGSISYEFASRGAARIVSIELSLKHYNFIKKAAENFGFDTIKVLKTDVFKYLKKATESFDLVFADAPFDMKGVEQLPDLVLASKVLKKEGILIVEHSEKIDFSEYSCFERLIKRGSVCFSFFSKKNE